MKTISEKTKISELIRQDPRSIDAIASIAKPLEKLKNPILRKIMASRVTIAEAAKMGGAPVREFMRVLTPLGFVFEENQTPEPRNNAVTKPEWLQHAAQEEIDWYDVRPIIDDGADPLKEILGRFKTVEPGKILCIINSFVPTPLIHLLKQEKAEDAFVETIADKEFHTYFLKKQKDTPVPSVPEEKVNMHSAETFAAVLNRFSEDQIKRIDVRALEMPGPMETILGELQTLPAGHALYVDHKRVPLYLLEELADKNFSIHIHHIDEGEVKVLIFPR